MLRIIRNSTWMTRTARKGRKRHLESTPWEELCGDGEEDTTDGQFIVSGLHMYNNVQLITCTCGTCYVIILGM